MKYRVEKINADQVTLVKELDYDGQVFAAMTLGCKQSFTAEQVGDLRLNPGSKALPVFNIGDYWEITFRVYQ